MLECDIMSVHGKLKRTIEDYIRVIKIAKKPTKEEYKAIVKITGLGILGIGLIGFIIQILKQLLTSLL